MNDIAFAVDNFVTTKAGDAIRLLPFGPLVKGGVEREITPEFAAKFKLPHFKPPIKLGSHDDETPAGGFITALEVRDDGLYALTELTDKGVAAWNEGHYRYQSPEIIWGEYGFEDPTTGEVIQGPLIVGTALLHTPHLGERAALYTVELEREFTDMNETVTVPTSLWDKMMARLFDKPQPEHDAEPQRDDNSAQVEQLTSLQRERDELAAKIEALEAEKRRAEQLAQLSAELQDKERFGSMFIELAAANEAATMLAGMTDEQRGWVMKNFGALAAQVNDSALFAEQGSAGSGAPSNPIEALNAAVKAVMEERKIGYNAALDVIVAEQPSLIEAAYPRK